MKHFPSSVQSFVFLCSVLLFQIFTGSVSRNLLVKFGIETKFIAYLLDLYPSWLSSVKISIHNKGFAYRWWIIARYSFVFVFVLHFEFLRFKEWMYAKLFYAKIITFCHILCSNENKPHIIFKNVCVVFCCLGSFIYSLRSSHNT